MDREGSFVYHKLMLSSPSLAFLAIIAQNLELSTQFPNSAIEV